MATVKLTTKNIFGTNGDLEKRLARLEAAAFKAATGAATEATRVSKDKAKAVRPPAPPRRGRTQTPGALARAIQWQAIGSDIVLDRKRLDNTVPWWVVQEIGTGKRAAAKRGEDTTGRKSTGRPKKDEINNPGGRHFAVKSQKGRRIPGHLVFASAVGAPYTRPGARRDQNLFPISAVQGTPMVATKAGGRAPAQSLVIRREIEGKHFIRDGAREGFRDYRNDLVAAAKATLARRK